MRVKIRVPPNSSAGRFLLWWKVRGGEAAQFDVIASGMTDPGCKRQNNEDFWTYHKPDDQVLRHKGVLAVVADGMGGHAAGEVASKLATETITRLYYAAEIQPPLALRRAFEASNREIYRRGQEDPQDRRMGTTCTALALYGAFAVYAHVGDTRLYRVRGRKIDLLTEDDSEVMALVRKGVITRKQARVHPNRNLIEKALGSEPELVLSAIPHPMPVRPDDRFVLCTDGLHDLVNDDEIRRATDFAPEKACTRLVTLAKERGGPDNITVVVLRANRRSTKEGPSPELRGA